MKKKSLQPSAFSLKRVDAPVFMTNQTVYMLVNCSICGEPLISIRSRILGICPGCFKRAGIEMGRILIVNPPTASARWN